MGALCSSSTSIAQDDEYKIPPHEQWRHAKCIVRAKHQLSILPNKEYCDYRRIAEQVKRKTSYHCEECKLNFCFKKERNHFHLWHSARCDHFRMYT